MKKYIKKIKYGIHYVCSDILTLLSFICSGIIATIVYFGDTKIFTDPSLKYASVVIWTMFFPLIRIAYKEILKKTLDIQEQDKGYIEAIHEIIKKFNFSYDQIIGQIELLSEGKLIVQTEYTMTVEWGISPKQSHIRTILEGEELAKYEAEVQSVSPTSVSKRILYEDTKRAHFEVIFNPELKEKDKVKYSVIERLSRKKPHLLSREEIQFYIKKGEWPINQPYEIYSFLTKYPTKKLLLRIILPDEYPVSGEELWDVVIGKSRIRAINEYDRLEKEGPFHKEEIIEKETTNIGETKIKRRQVLELKINNPKVGFSYWLKWLAPFEIILLHLNEKGKEEFMEHEAKMYKMDRQQEIRGGGVRH